MSELDDKLNSILSNPQMMQQIMSLAQSLNQQETKKETPTQDSKPKESGFNPAVLSNLSKLMQNGSIDRNQQTLLNALSPYLSNQKITKLKKAMQAAKIANLASEMSNSRGQNPRSGR